MFIGNNMNATIIVVGLITLGFLVKNYIGLCNQNQFIKEAVNRKNTTSVMNKETKEIKDVETKEAVTPDTVRIYVTEFNKVVSKFNVLAQIIPIFPLLGIFGTVAGLISQLQAQDLDAMFASLDIALGSTFWGLLVAIILKVFVAFFSARTIEETEIMIEDYDKKFDNATKMGNVENN